MPVKKQPIRPIIIAKIKGKVIKSPVLSLYLIIFFVSSTPIKPKVKPPMIVLLVQKKRKGFFASKRACGFSNVPIILDPKSAPIKAPIIILNDCVIDKLDLFRFRRNA